MSGLRDSIGNTEDGDQDAPPFFVLPVMLAIMFQNLNKPGNRQSWERGGA